VSGNLVIYKFVASFLDEGDYLVWRHVMNYIVYKHCFTINLI
jgi:hypothetical protein